MRKRQAVKREVLADPIYNSKMVTKLINRIMIGGKKGTAQNILYDAFDIVKEKTGNDPMETFNSRRIGGGNYQVPVEVKEDRGQALALRWLVQYAKNRSGKGMAENLANEIIDAANGVGGAVKKREDTHKMAEANKAYAHYRW